MEGDRIDAPHPPCYNPGIRMPHRTAEPQAHAWTPFAKMAAPRRLSYLLFVAIVISSTALQLGPLVLSGLFSYLILDLSHRRLSQAMRPFYAKLSASIIFVVAALALGWIFWEFLRQAMAALPRILTIALPRMADVLDRYGVDLPFETLHEFREAFMATLKENAMAVTRVTGLLTRRFFHILAGIIVAILCFFSHPMPSHGASYYESIRRDLNERMRTFLVSFELVFGAQLVMSGINTVMTTVYLLATGIPFRGFLVPATFVLGLLPVIGGVLSNTIIVGAALAVSPNLALISLLYLMTIHKIQYIMNGRMLGTSLESPMWLILIGIVVGELVMGVPGIILAPALLHYVRVELQAIPDESRPL